MADRTGLATVAGLALSPSVTSETWPPGATTVTQLLPLLRESLAERPLNTPQNRQMPTTGPQAGALLGRLAAGNLIVSPTLNGSELIWALIMGRMRYSDGVSTYPLEIVPGAYRHVYEVDDLYHAHAWRLNDGVLLDDGVDLDQQMLQHGTTVVDKGGESAWQFIGTNIARARLRTGDRESRLELETLCHSLEKDSVSNPNLDGATKPSWQHVEHVRLTFRIGPQSTITPLGPSDEFKLDTFDFEINHGIEGRQRSDTGFYIGAPRRARPPQFAATLSLPRVDSETLDDWARSSTRLMASATYDGAEIASTGEFYRFTIWMPDAILVENESPTDGGRVYAQRYGMFLNTPNEAVAGIPVTAELSPIVIEMQTDSGVNPFY